MASEFSAFNSLCINWESTLLMRSEESRMDLAQAIVIGPRDTAYANGIFVFDLQARHGHRAGADHHDDANELAIE